MPVDESQQDFLTESTQWRRAGPGSLSLALMDARNHSLLLYAQLEAQYRPDSGEKAQALGLSPCLWELGLLGWYQEFWVSRNLRRAAGADCEPAPPRIASVLTHADGYWNSALSTVKERWQMDLPDAESTRNYLLQTLEANLELLERTPESDQDLYFHRLALQHEDAWFERMCMLAQALDLHLEMPAPRSRASREPLSLPTTRWTMGWTEPGFASDYEMPAHPVALPDFEIDAQAVSWAQYVEFVEDAGYDREELWLPEGWAWLQRRAAAEGRRGPRHVQQISLASGAVLLQRFGRTSRMSGSQPAQHVSWWEAEAWCRWARRRLATEVEWEAAAVLAARRGFAWGDVLEWTASTFRPYPGFVPGPDRSLSWSGPCKAVRGASFATRPRQRHPRLRRFLPAHCDDAFIGFRSCAS